MLAQKREIIRMNSHCVKYFVILMKLCKCMLKLGKCFFSDYIPVNEITELKECPKSMDNIIRDVPFDCREVYLCKYQYIDRSTCIVLNHLTFISTFKSSPVHCENPCPLRKCCRPENGGTMAILFTFSKCCNSEKKNTYWQSISAKISFASVFPWTRYFVTHSTRWSLKVPLINWWRMLGAKSKWMLAQGNLSVNSYHSTTVSVHHINILYSHLNLAINSPIIP